MTEVEPNKIGSSASGILVLEAFEHVRKDRLKEYEQMGAAIDAHVQATEPGMLVHALTKISETEHDAIYRWLEVFDGEKALEAHLSNPHVTAHIEAMNTGVLSGETRLIIYSNWNATQKDFWKNRLSGAHLTYAPMITGFFLAR